VRGAAFGAALALAMAAALNACGGSTQPGPPPDCSSVADTTAAATVTYAAHIAPLIERYGCGIAGCHGDLGTRSRYSVTSYDDLFDAGEQATALRVCAIRPGMPDSSYVLWKLEGRGGIRGAQMPDDRGKLTPEDLALERTWILEGAR
jgi:hypothetical protein